MPMIQSLFAVLCIAVAALPQALAMAIDACRSSSSDKR